MVGTFILGFISPPFFEKSGDGAGNHFGGELPAGRRRGQTLAGTGKRGTIFCKSKFFSVSFFGYLPYTDYTTIVGNAGPDYHRTDQYITQIASELFVAVYYVVSSIS